MIQKNYCDDKRVIGLNGHVSAGVVDWSLVNVCVTCFSWRWELVTRRRRERARTRSAVARCARNTSSCTKRWTGRSTSSSSTSSERYGTRSATRGRWEKWLVYTARFRLGFRLRFGLQTQWLHCTMQKFSHCTESVSHSNFKCQL